MTKSTLFAYAKNRPLRACARDLAPTIAGRQRGISLIEGILYLVLALGLVVGGIVLFQNAQLSSRVTETARGIVSISSETRALHQNARDFDNGTGTEQDLTTALVRAGAVPSNFLNGVAADTMEHPWGGPIAVSGLDQNFTITLTGVPSEACVRLVPVDDRGQGVAGIGIASVEINGTTLNAPVSPIQAGTECDDSVAGSNNVAFTYDR